MKKKFKRMVLIAIIMVCLAVGSVMYLKKVSVENLIIGQWNVEKIIDTKTNEQRGFSSYYGPEITQNYHFEFYDNGAYEKLLGSVNEKGKYTIEGDTVCMISLLDGKETKLKICKDKENNKTYLLENDGKIIEVYYIKQK